MHTPQDSILAHVDIDSKPIFRRSNSPNLWNVDEIWIHQLIVVDSRTPKQTDSLAVISRQPLVLMQSKEVKQKVENQDISISITIKAGEKLKVEGQKNIKNLDRFCRFLMHVDLSRKSSKPDRFLIPLAGAKIDWQRVEDPFRGIPIVRDGFTTLEKIYKDCGGSRLGSMINRFALTKSFSTGFSNRNANQLLDILVCSKANHQSCLPFRFWSISDCTTSFISNIPGIEFKNNLKGLPVRLKQWNGPRKRSPQELALIGKSFMRRVMWARLFHSEGSRKEVEGLLAKELEYKNNIARLGRVYLVCQLSKEYKKIEYLIGACYFYESNQQSAMLLGQQMGLAYMDPLREGIWTENNIKLAHDPTDAERELEARLKYKFNDINLLRKAVSPDHSSQHERLEWLGGSVLDDWAARYRSDLRASDEQNPCKYFNNEDLQKCVANLQWLPPCKGRVGSDDGVRSVSLVLALIGVMYIDCNGDFYPESTLDIVMC